MTAKPDASNYISDRVFDGTRPLSADRVAKMRANYTATQYPELRVHVRDLVPQIMRSINHAANITRSEMPYKSQWILEEIIKELERYV